MDKYKELLTELIAFKSISTDKQYVEEIDNTAKWLLSQFEKKGFQTQIYKGYGNPVVYAKYDVHAEETVLVYGHYDVQPATKSNGWESDPFTLTQRKGRLLGRGIVDNKGQFLIHVISIFDLIDKGALKYNIKFILEGNEETGGEGLDKLLIDKKDELKCDYIIISDGELPYKPVITASFRGTFNTTLQVRTAKNNLHSGLYGGTVPNAAIELSKLISKLYDDQNKITIPKFYDGIEKVSEQELKNCKIMDDEKKHIIESIGVKKIFTGKDDSYCKTLGFETMFTISGIKSGYADDGYSNIIPATATAKVNFRIAPGQKSINILNLFTSYVKGIAPDYVTVEIIDTTESVDAIKVDINSPMHKKVMRMLKEVYGSDTLTDYCGASIPIVYTFQDIFGVDPLLVSLGNDDCNMHGANENFDISLIKKGLEFSKRFFEK